MVLAADIRVVNEFSRRISDCSLISRSLHTAEEIYACLFESHLCPFSDTSADQYIDICSLQEPRKRAVPISV